MVGTDIRHKEYRHDRRRRREEDRRRGRRDVSSSDDEDDDNDSDGHDNAPLAIEGPGESDKVPSPPNPHANLSKQPVPESARTE